MTSLFEIGSVILKNFKSRSCIIISPWKEDVDLHWNTLNSIYPFVPSMVAIVSVVLEKKLFLYNSLMHKFTILLLTNRGKGRDPSFNKLESWSPMGLFEIGQLVLEKETKM